MDFDFKITVWERVTVPEDMEQTILDKIKNGEIQNSCDIKDLVPEAVVDLLHDTESQMLPEENDNLCTIDVMENGESIYQN